MNNFFTAKSVTVVYPRFVWLTGLAHKTGAVVVRRSKGLFVNDDRFVAKFLMRATRAFGSSNVWFWHDMSVHSGRLQAAIINGYAAGSTVVINLLPFTHDDILAETLGSLSSTIKVLLYCSPVMINDVLKYNLPVVVEDYSQVFAPNIPVNKWFGWAHRKFRFPFSLKSSVRILINPEVKL